MEALKEKVKGLLDNPEVFETKFEEMFTKFDANSNGVLEKSEMTNVIHYFYEEMGADQPSEEKVNELISKIDTNNDEVVSKDELRTWVLKMFTKLTE